MPPRRFLVKFLVYLVIVIAIHAALLVYLGGVAMGNDISNEERTAMAAPALFIINHVFGFPLALFVPYDPVNEVRISLPLVLIFLSNCLLQFVILSFLWRKLVRNKNYK
jgi:hypothetical protein